MTSFLLSLDESTADAGGYDETFLWSGSSPRSTFVGPLDPHLSAFGPVRQTNVDFVRLALAVFAADRSVRRQGGGSDWNQRDFEVTIEVGKPTAWRAHANDLSTAIGFLTGDRWTFKFQKAIPNPAASLPVDDPAPDRTVLLSGGADSASGALLAALDLPEGSTLQLVSHFSAPSISPFQKELVERIRVLAPA